ncbi:MAG: hypothetical protein QXX87_02270, partial [Candidatus Jordarchaeales archaeon]
MSIVSRHWHLTIGFVGAMFALEAIVAFASTSTSMLYYLLVTGFPALILLQAASSPTITATLSLLGVTGCVMVLYVVANYTKASMFKEKILVISFLLAALYLFSTSLARSELSTAIALTKAITLFSALPASIYEAALTLVIQFSPPSGYGASLGLKAEFQFSTLSGNLLLASSLFLLLLGLLATLSSFLKGWGIDKKVFYITGTISSILASLSEFLSPYSFAFRELNAGYMILPSSRFGGDRSPPPPCRSALPTRARRTRAAPPLARDEDGL